MSTASVAICGLAGVALVAQGGATAPPVPIDPIPALLDALETHDVVGLSAGEGHGDVRGQAFVISLLRDPAFARLPVDIVFENGNARFQAVMDRYVRGEDVPMTELRRAWDDTTQPQVVSAAGEVPAIVRAIRDVNTGRALPRQIRLLLPDPPIDWDLITSRNDFQKWLALRDTSGAGVVRRHALAQKRRVLLLYGAGHLQRRNQLSNYEMDNLLAQTVVSLLEASGATTFIVRTAGADQQAGMQSWPVPSLTRLRGTTLGAAPEPSVGQRVAVRDGRLVPIPRAEWVDVRLQEQADALLYLGPSAERQAAPLPASLCTEPGYLEARLTRMTVAGLPAFELDRLRTFCAKQ